MDPRDLRDAFAANLRRLRHAKGISQEDLANEAGINRSYMSKLEKGASYPGLEIIAKLATVLEVEPARAAEGAGGRREIDTWVCPKRNSIAYYLIFGGHFASRERNRPGNSAKFAELCSCLTHGSVRPGTGSGLLNRYCCGTEGLKHIVDAIYAKIQSIPSQ
jgi:transcriptional regulator with XRE-family HTH domain